MLTPEDIQSREFLVSLRGYDRDEVRAFLDEVAGAYAAALGQAALEPASPAGDAGPDSAPEPEPAPAPPKHEAPPDTPAPTDPSSAFAAIGAETQRILEAAHAAGEQIRARASADAQRERDAAIAEAEEEVASLQVVASEIRSIISELESQRDRVAHSLRQARETVDLALLEIDASVVAAPPDDSARDASVLAADAAADAAHDDAHDAGQDAGAEGVTEGGDVED